jgi:hypothetical protein
MDEAKLEGYVIRRCCDEEEEENKEEGVGGGGGGDLNVVRPRLLTDSVGNSIHHQWQEELVAKFRVGDIPQIAEPHTQNHKTMEETHLDRRHNVKSVTEVNSDPIQRHVATKTTTDDMKQQGALLIIVATCRFSVFDICG